MRKIQLPTKEIKEKYESGQSTNTIARQYSVNSEIVRKRLVESGVRMRRHKKVNETQLRQAIKLYLSSKKVSLVQLGGQFNISGDGLRKRFINKGVIIRNSAEMVRIRNRERTNTD